jgi:hypothetical protein
MKSFKSFSLCAFFLVTSASLLWVFNCSFTRQKDHARYRAFREKQHEISQSSSELVSKHAYQTREGVRKDIWTAEANNVRMHYRIESRSSLLKLTPGNKKMELVENLSGIRCWMQDKLLLTNETKGVPLQQVRYLEADTGSYLYNTQQFEASSVSLFLLRLPGHTLTFDVGPKDAFLRGIAQNVSFVISDGTPKFQAQNFKASIKGSEL